MAFVRPGLINGDAAASSDFNTAMLMQNYSLPTEGEDNGALETGRMSCVNSERSSDFEVNGKNGSGSHFTGNQGVHHVDPAIAGPSCQ